MSDWQVVSDRVTLIETEHGWEAWEHGIYLQSGSYDYLLETYPFSRRKYRVMLYELPDKIEAFLRSLNEV